MNTNSIKLSAGIAVAAAMLMAFPGNVHAQSSMLNRGPAPTYSTQAQTNLTTSQLLGQLNTITTAVPFLMITPDSRAGGMGETGVATTADVKFYSLECCEASFR